jgi:hypothetical protein
MPLNGSIYVLVVAVAPKVPLVENSTSRKNYEKKEPAKNAIEVHAASGTIVTS